MLTEEEPSSTIPPKTNLTSEQKSHSQIESHPELTKSILASTTLDEESLNEASMEFKEIPSSHEKTYINQESYVTKQIHETMSDEDDQVMISSNLITDELQESRNENVEEKSASKTPEELEMIKQVASDFVKTLSQEALEILKDRITPDPPAETIEVPSRLPRLPTFEVTLSSEQNWSVATDGFHHHDEEEISSLFQFQTSFRCHYVSDFSNNETDEVLVDEKSEGDQTVPKVNDSQHDTSFDDINGTDEPRNDTNQTADDSLSGKSGSNQMVDSSEDIWAGEDIVMLRKSKTTFSVKSSKTDSESLSNDTKNKSDRNSGTDQEWSSSGDPYHTAHGSSSRPSSSDVDAMLSAQSGRGSSMTTTTEYETAHSHTESSQHSSSYHTAALTLSSKSFSEKSGHLASFEVSETSDTLIDISIEPEDREPGACTPQGQDDVILPHDEEEGPISQIVRSPEMFFGEKRETITGSIVTISSASDNTTTVIQQDLIEPVIEQKEMREEIMMKSTGLTESTSSATSERAIISCPTPPTGSGEILGSIEELKKDESPGVEQIRSTSSSSNTQQITRVVSFDTSNLETTSPNSNRASLFKDQKSFDSEFGSRPESELKDFDSRPQSLSEAMTGESDSRPTSKNASDTDIDLTEKNIDPFQRPDSPEPPLTDTSPMDEKNVKTELAFSTHFTQVIEDEEYQKLDEVPEYQIMTAVEIPQKEKLRGTHSFDLTETTASPPTINKPLSSGMIWRASADLNMEDEEAEPIGKRGALHSESEDEEGLKPGSVDIDDNWDEAVEPISRDQSLSEGSDFVGFAYNPPLDQIIEEEEEPNEEAQLKELKNLKESLSSTPEFEMIADRRALCLKLNEKDNSSLSSLQEFESLEQAIVLPGGSASGSGSRNSMGSQDSLETGPVVANKNNIPKKVHSKPASSHGSSGSLSEFEQMEVACKAAESLEHMAKHQETALSEIEEGHESQISESESCETLSQGGKSDDSAEFNQRMHQIDEIIRQAQTNVETFDQPQQYMSCIMEASTDSLEANGQKKDQIPSMVTSTDSLEDKFQNSSNNDDLMKISTDSIELSKKLQSAKPVPASSANLMVASTDSLESGSTNTKPSASMLSSAASHTSETFISEFDIVRTGYDSGLDRLIESADESSTMSNVTSTTCASTTVTTSQCMVSYGFNVSEVILPKEDGGLVSTIERTVEMPAEVTKIQFKGPNAEVKMNEYVQSIAGGKSLQEVESVDASGNVIHKRVIQQRLYSEDH